MRNLNATVSADPTKVTLTLIRFAVPAILLLESCSQGEGFRCGVRLNDDGPPRVCDGQGEICVCDTASCARPASDCASGYQYLSAPFARAYLAKRCVTERSHTVQSTDPVPLCELSDASLLRVDAAPIDAAGMSRADGEQEDSGESIGADE